jgi:RHS repeat-associated protein
VRLRVITHCAFLTQKERDNESGLDYFGARYYGSSLGRFTSPDPLFASGRSPSPQTWNRYAYVLNNPLRLVDPSGLIDEEQNQQQKPKVIYVFVAFTKEEQERRVVPDNKKIPTFVGIAAPDFQKLKDSAPKGTTVQVFEGSEATVDKFKEALQDPNAAGVFFIGHSASDNPEARPYVADGINLADGSFTEDDKVDVKAQTVGVFGCDTKNVGGLFVGSDGKGPTVIGVDSGKDGLSATNGLTQAGYSAAQTIIKGGSPDQAVIQANAAFTKTVGPLRVRDPNRNMMDVRPYAAEDGGKVRRIP